MRCQRGRRRPRHRPEHRRLGQRQRSGSATPSASPCSTSIPTAPRSSSTGSSGRSRASWPSSENGDPIARRRPPRCASLGFTVVRHKTGASRRRIGSQRQTQLEQRAAAGATAAARHRGRHPAACASRCGTTPPRRWFDAPRPAHRPSSVVGHGERARRRPRGGVHPGHRRATETPASQNRPVHVHEAMFGWEGWSLAAPRPGKRVRHENGQTRSWRTEPDADPDPGARRSSSSPPRWRPGTLPRLRYGRSYAFRAWAVDLAGNVRPHELNPPPADPAAIAGGAERRRGGRRDCRRCHRPAASAGCVARRLGDWRRKRLAPGVEQLSAMALREPAPIEQIVRSRPRASCAPVGRPIDSAAVDRRRRLVGPAARRLPSPIRGEVVRCGHGGPRPVSRARAQSSPPR